MEETKKEVKEPSAEPSIRKRDGSPDREKNRGLLSSVKALFKRGTSEGKKKPEEKPEEKKNSQTKIDDGTKRALIAVGGLLTAVTLYFAYNHFTATPAPSNRSTYNVRLNSGTPVNRINATQSIAHKTARSKETVRKPVLRTTTAATTRATTKTASGTTATVEKRNQKESGQHGRKGTVKKAVAEKTVTEKDREPKRNAESGWSSAKNVQTKEEKTRQEVQTVKKGTGSFFVNPDRVRFPNFKAFQEFYIKRLIELINQKKKELEEIQEEKQKISKEIAQLQMEVQRIAIIPKQVEKEIRKNPEKKRKKKEKPVPVAIPVTVYGVVCHGTCKAYTDKGILTPGSILPNGEKVEKITPHYIKTNLRTIEF